MKRLALVLAAAGVGVLPLGTIARAGGSCHAEVSTGDTDHVVSDHACFNPTVIRVAPNTTVTWENESETAHNIHGLEPGGVIKDYQLPAGGSVRLAFPYTGVFSYMCTLHPNMKGVVTVADGFASHAPEPVTPIDPSPVSLSTSEDGIELRGGGLVGVGAGLAVAASGLGFVVGRRRPTAE